LIACAAGATTVTIAVTGRTPSMWACTAATSPASGMMLGRYRARSAPHRAVTVLQRIDPGARDAGNFERPLLVVVLVAALRHVAHAQQDARAVGLIDLDVAAARSAVFAVATLFTPAIGL
jgi:hypothetical protein